MKLKTHILRTLKAPKALHSWRLGDMMRRVQYPLQTSCSSVCGIFKGHAFTRFCGCGLAPHPKVPRRGRWGPGTPQGAQDPQWCQEGPSLQVPPLSAASPAGIMRASHAALESWRGISSRDPQRQRRGAQVANGRQRHGSRSHPHALASPWSQSL